MIYHHQFGSVVRLMHLNDVVAWRGDDFFSDNFIHTYNVCFTKRLRHIAVAEIARQYSYS